jgi:hypothetical protein
MGFKRSGHAEHGFPSGFLDKKSLAAGTAIFFGPESDDRGAREQCPRQGIVIKPDQSLAQCKPGFGSRTQAFFLPRVHRKAFESALC